MVESGEFFDRQPASWAARKAGNMDQFKLEELKSREVGDVI